MKIGFHLPISKGFEWTRKEATRLGCEVIQIFVKNPRSWGEKRLADEECQLFLRLFHDLPVVAHLSYLPNLAASDEDGRSLRAFMHEAELACEVGIGSLVVHCGSREDILKGIDAVARSVSRVLARLPLSLLLETSAGQGKAIGKSVDELARIHRAIGAPDRVGFCLDTAHLFEAGYDVRRRPVWRSIASELENRCGESSIRFFHLNDSKTPMASAVDRHWHIGKGEIGLGAFRYLVNDKKLAHLGGVMETPKMGKMDERNMKVMRSLLSPLVSRPSS